MAAARYLTFDCYGTLIDWERGIGDAFVHEARHDGIELDRRLVLAAWAAVEPGIQQSGYRSYREVLGETALAVARRCGFPLAEARAGFLAASLPDWLPFPDTRPALERIARAGLRLGILSNVDDDLLEASVERIGVELELRVTAQRVRSYKPAHAHFLEARRRIGAGEWRHAAQSYFHDVEPALALGVPVIWVNRKSEPLDGRPEPLQEVRDLTELANVLA